MEGIVFDLKRFAVHDGEGLRTTLFLKGCPLHCPWCQNPEGMDPRPILWYAPGDCVGCSTCVNNCPENVLTFQQRVHADRDGCSLCGTCADVCPAGAIEIRGEKITSEEAVSRLTRDKLFFRENGGVTLSGGEVLLQWEFAREVLAGCKDNGIDTAIETCLHAPLAAVKEMMGVTDHFIIDIKYLDPEIHRRVLGPDNRHILENYEYLVKAGADILVRTPLIPGYTASEENIRAIAKYIVKTDPNAKYELLNYNPLCKSKYAALEADYPVEQSTTLSREEMDAFYRILETEQVPGIIRE